MNNYNQKNEIVNSGTKNSPLYWLDKAGKIDVAPAALICAAKTPPEASSSGSPPSPNRGGDKYVPAVDKFLCIKGLGTNKLLHASSGVDYLCYGVYGRFLDSIVFDRLNDAKNKGEEYINLFGTLCQLSPGGLRDGVYYPFVLTWHGVKILINPSARGTIAPVRVHISGLPLLQCDWRIITNEVRRLLVSWHFEYLDTSVSRVDLQVTLRVPYSSLCKDVLSTRVVTDCRGDVSIFKDINSGSPSTVWYRSRTIELCIYDKAREIRAGKVSADYAILWSWMYNGDEQGDLTRVEFRLRSDALRRWRVRSLETLDEMMPAIADRLTGVWFRVLSRSKVRGHEREQSLSSQWLTVRRAFAQVFDGSMRPIVPVRRVKETPQASRLIKQAAGCLASVVPIIADGARPSDVEEAITWLIDKVSDALPDKAKTKIIESRLVNT